MIETLKDKRMKTRASLMKNGFSESQADLILDVLDNAMTNAIDSTFQYTASLIEASLKEGHYATMSGNNAADLIARSLRLGATMRSAPTGLPS